MVIDLVCPACGGGMAPIFDTSRGGLALGLACEASRDRVPTGAERAHRVLFVDEEGCGAARADVDAADDPTVDYIRRRLHDSLPHLWDGARYGVKKPSKGGKRSKAKNRERSSVVDLLLDKLGIARLVREERERFGSKRPGRSVPHSAEWALWALVGECLATYGSVGLAGGAGGEEGRRWGEAAPSMFAGEPALGE